MKFCNSKTVTVEAGETVVGVRCSEWKDCPEHLANLQFVVCKEVNG